MTLRLLIVILIVLAFVAASYAYMNNDRPTMVKAVSAGLVMVSLLAASYVLPL